MHAHLIGDTLNNEATVRKFCPLSLSFYMQIVASLVRPIMVKTSAAHYSMLAKQDSLPPLPVPSLQQTMDKYLLAIKPLVDEEDYEYTKDLVKDFLKQNGDGEVLHNKLLQRAKTEKNWVRQCLL